jgi:hypothetical protein
MPGLVRNKDQLTDALPSELEGRSEVTLEEVAHINEVLLPDRFIEVKLAVEVVDDLRRKLAPHTGQIEWTTRRQVTRAKGKHGDDEYDRDEQENTTNEKRRHVRPLEVGIGCQVSGSLTPGTRYLGRYEPSFKS